MVHLYGMRLRGYSPGCQPKRGLVEAICDRSDRYWDILTYDRKLSDQEVDEYELDYLGVAGMPASDIEYSKGGMKMWTEAQKRA